MKTNIFRSDSHLLMVMHILLSTALLYFISSSSGCNDDPEDLGGHSLGKQVESTKIFDTYWGVMESKGPLDLAIGDATLYERNYRIEMGTIVKVEEMISALEGASITNNILSMRFTQQRFYFDEYGNVVEETPKEDIIVEFELVEGDEANYSVYGTKSKESVSENEVNLRNFQLTPHQKLRLLGDLRQRAQEQIQELLYNKKDKKLIEAYARHGVKIEPFSVYPNAKNEVKRVTYHQLHVDNFVQKAPQKVSQKPNCLGIPKCQFNATEITFDEVLWFSDTKYQKIRKTWVVSPDPPGLAGGVSLGLGGMLSQCQVGLLSIETDEGQKEFLASVCESILRDLAFGGD